MTDDQSAPAQPRPPTSEEIRILEEWQKFTTSNLTRITATAGKWQTGLAGFVAVVTSVFILKGPDSFGKISSPYNWWVVGLLVLGLIAMLVGLWLAQAAAAPVQTAMTYEDFKKENTSEGAVESDIARKARTKLIGAQWFVAIALLSFIAGIVLWVVAPQASAKTLIAVELGGDDTVCGSLVASEQGKLLVLPDGKKETRTIELADLDSALIVKECPAP